MVDNEGSQGQQINSAPQKERLTPRGEITLGTTDPRTLTPEQFKQSPNILFHGGKTASFNRDHVYTLDPKYSSQTLGPGYYTTDSRESAEIYSRLRTDGKEPIAVTEVLPYKARMWDFRSTMDSNRNAAVPRELFDEFRQFFEDDYKKRFPEGYEPDYITRPLPDKSIAYMAMNAYRIALMRKARENREFDLRQVLSTDNDLSKSENGAPFFTQFMLQKGFDGIIYNEYGDHSSQEFTASHVFYKLDSVGDYATWQQTPKDKDDIDISGNDIREVLKGLSNPTT